MSYYHLKMTIFIKLIEKINASIYRVAESNNQTQ